LAISAVTDANPIRINVGLELDPSAVAGTIDFHGSVSSGLICH
jgi:hypothetical protein